jgi:hypothetical protein
MLLSSSLPGLVVNPPGETNGPVTPTLFNQLGISSSAAAKLDTALEDGELYGDIRVWSSGTAPGEVVEIVAYHLSTLYNAETFLAGEEVAAGTALTGRFPVSGVADAEGFSGVAYNDAGSPFDEISVTFGKANVMVEVVVGSPTGALTRSDAASLVVRQSAALPGGPLNPVTPSNENGAYELGEALVPTLLVIALIWALVVQRRKRRLNRAALTIRDYPWIPRDSAAQSPSSFSVATRPDWRGQSSSRQPSARPASLAPDPGPGVRSIPNGDETAAPTRPPLSADDQRTNWWNEP